MMTREKHQPGARDAANELRTLGLDFIFFLRFFLFVRFTRHEARQKLNRRMQRRGKRREERRGNSENNNIIGQINAPGTTLMVIAMI